MRLFNTTTKWVNWWANRKLDWKVEYLDTWDHPHRSFIVAVLKSFPWLSLIELGCGSGPNLVKIVKSIPNRQIGGVDINPEAIALAEQTFRGGVFKVGSADDVMMSDRSTDVVLTDMLLIYIGQLKVDNYIREIRRIARKYVVFCELHTTSPWKRLLLKFNSGYNAHNYKKLLTKHGFYDIEVYKVPKEAGWGGEPQDTFAHIIIAKVPKR
jgi:ubiquinone/menaquinone biosynthesis C-methylase UbiE